jgi:hypothetical protein
VFLAAQQRFTAQDRFDPPTIVVRTLYLRDQEGVPDATTSLTMRDTPAPTGTGALYLRDQEGTPAATTALTIHDVSGISVAAPLYLRDQEGTPPATSSLKLRETT